MPESITIPSGTDDQIGYENSNELIEAIFTGNVSVIQHGIDNGVDMNRTLTNNMTPLQLMLENCPAGRRLDMVETLVEGGANPLATFILSSANPSRFHPSPLTTAFRKGMRHEFASMLGSPFVDLLDKDAGGNTLAHRLTPKFLKAGMAAAVEGLQLVQRHFERYVMQEHPELSANHLWYVPNNAGVTPAMAASAAPPTLHWMLGDPKINLRSRLEDVDVEGQTLLFKAAIDASLDSVRLLISHGARVDLHNAKGVSLIGAVNEHKTWWGQKAAGPGSNLEFVGQFDLVIGTLRAAKASREASLAIDTVIDSARAGSARLAP